MLELRPPVSLLYSGPNRIGNVGTDVGEESLAALLRRLPDREVSARLYGARRIGSVRTGEP